MEDFLTSAKKQLLYYKSVGEKTMAQLQDEDLFWIYNDESNSVAMIVQHLWGNMLSRWTDFLTSDGEKPWRNRDQEFEAVIKTRADLMDKWNAGWRCLFDALDAIKPEDWNKPVFIRGERHSVVDAINRQLAHYPYHIGQIVFIGKMAASGWQALTIPKGKSQTFNDDMFGKK
ncbi:DUF1572 family protein [Mucilaginibacter panaciglaebae]|uniref:DUF1572 domain-containing protein n=1 Tax=Mucilaginibacter panaciglaebae TaxID=502331 RepID=A0ABP7WN47_9SPHI